MNGESEKKGSVVNMLKNLNELMNMIAADDQLYLRSDFVRRYNRDFVQMEIYVDGRKLFVLRQKPQRKRLCKVVYLEPP